MLIIDINDVQNIYPSEEAVKDALKFNRELTVRISIRRARHYSDLAHDYLEAAFIGEKLSSLSTSIELKKKSDDLCENILEFHLIHMETNLLCGLIWGIAQMYIGNEDAANDFMDEFLAYKDRLDEIKHAFPELVDVFYINQINGGYYEYDPIDNKDFFEEEFSRFPERKYGFHKSAYSTKYGQNFYTSIDSIIVPKSSDLKVVLNHYSGIDDIHFMKSDFLVIGNIAYLFSNGFIVHFPFDAFIKAKHCARQGITKEVELYEQEGTWMSGFLAYKRRLAKISELENLKGYPEDCSHEFLKGEIPITNSWLHLPEVNGFYLSAYGDHILVEDGAFNYFFFGADKLNINELGFLGTKLSNLFNIAANLAGYNVEVNCPWKELNDESFEELCYDVIYHNPKFDNSTIRKLGKAKSRDGGRDITVSTHSRPGKPAIKYIFQCKFLKPRSSLTGTKVLDISDTVTQFDAKGYGIMTNVVIDATLYDKLDRISKNLQIEVDDFPIYKLERILAATPHIRRRHFSV